MDGGLVGHPFAPAGKGLMKTGTRTFTPIQAFGSHVKCAMLAEHS